VNGVYDVDWSTSNKENQKGSNPTTTYDNSKASDTKGSLSGKTGSLNYDENKSESKYINGDISQNSSSFNGSVANGQVNWSAGNTQISGNVKTGITGNGSVSVGQSTTSAKIEYKPSTGLSTGKMSSSSFLS
jgi:hypothetical protein